VQCSRSRTTRSLTHCNHSFVILATSCSSAFSKDNDEAGGGGAGGGGACGGGGGGGGAGGGKRRKLLSNAIHGQLDFMAFLTDCVENFQQLQLRNHGLATANSREVDGYRPGASTFSKTECVRGGRGGKNRIEYDALVARGGTAEDLAATRYQMVTLARKRAGARGGKNRTEYDDLVAGGATATELAATAYEMVTQKGKSSQAGKSAGGLAGKFTVTY
jgi:hypothetical protein